MALFYRSVPVGHDSVTVSRHAQYQDSETEAAKWDSAITHFITRTCAFPTVTCLNSRCFKPQMVEEMLTGAKNVVFCFHPVLTHSKYQRTLSHYIIVISHDPHVRSVVPILHAHIAQTHKFG